jgi:hypothetical protein
MWPYSTLLVDVKFSKTPHKSLEETILQEFSFFKAVLGSLNSGHISGSLAAGPPDGLPSKPPPIPLRHREDMRTNFLVGLYPGPVQKGPVRALANSISPLHIRSKISHLKVEDGPKHP